MDFGSREYCPNTLSNLPILNRSGLSSMYNSRKLHKAYCKVLSKENYSFLMASCSIWVPTGNFCFLLTYSEKMLTFQQDVMWLHHSHLHPLISSWCIYYKQSSVHTSKLIFKDILYLKIYAWTTFKKYWNLDLKAGS